MKLINTADKRKPGFYLALAGCLLAIGVLGLGAFTRLVDAGLGCPDWPGCYGHALWPKSVEDIAVANQAFPDAPVETDKTWPEMVHRYFAKTLGVLTIGIYLLAMWRRQDQQPIKVVNTLLGFNLFFTILCMIYGNVMEPFAVTSVLITFGYLGYQYRQRGNSERPYKHAAFLLAFIILQGLFGMWTVTLKLWPQVVTAHLLGGFTTLSLLWLMVLRLNNIQWQLPAAAYSAVTALRRPALIGLLIVIVQITLGGWTTSNYAAVACPDLPTCQAQWWPDMDLAEGFNVLQGIGPNYLGGVMNNEARVAIHMSHRIGAMVTTVYLLWLVWLLVSRVGVAESRRMAGLVGAMLGLQVLLGLGNILLHFPLYVTVSHNLGGALLLLTMVTLMHRVYTCQPQHPAPTETATR